MLAPKKGVPMRPHVGPFYYHPDGKLTLFPPEHASKSQKETPGAGASTASNLPLGTLNEAAAAKSKAAVDKPKKANVKSKSAAAKPKKSNVKSKSAAAKPRMSDQAFQEYVRTKWKQWVRKVNGDGSCQFYAFLDIDGYSTADAGKADQLRAEVVEWVIANSDKITSTFIGRDKILNLRQTVRERAIDEHRLKNIKGDNWKAKYSKKMLHPNGYATDLELGAAAVLKGVDVYVFERNEDPNEPPSLELSVPFGEGNGKRRFALLFDRANNYEEAQHYDRYNLPDAVLDRFIEDTKDINEAAKKPAKKQK